MCCRVGRSTQSGVLREQATWVRPHSYWAAEQPQGAAAPHYWSHDLPSASRPIWTSVELSAEQEMLHDTLTSTHAPELAVLAEKDDAPSRTALGSSGASVHAHCMGLNSCLPSVIRTCPVGRYSFGQPMVVQFWTTDGRMCTSAQCR